MLELIKQYSGYIIGSLLFVIEYIIFKAIKGTFKRKVKEDNTKKHHKK